VIGINTAIRPDAQGLGFAIPIETAQRVAEQLITKGKVDHPYLGIQVVDINPSVRKEINQRGGSLRINQDPGVLIVRGMDNSPAEQAGLQPGDIIQKIGGKPVLHEKILMQPQTLPTDFLPLHHVDSGGDRHHEG